MKRKITNRLNLPEPLYKAIVNDSYTPGESDITATGLIEPVQIAALKNRYGVEEDASDLIYSLQGQSIHTILERAAKDLKDSGYLAEERLYMDVNGVKVGAQIDVFHIESGVLQDYKVTSVYSVKNGLKEDYARQLNIQAQCLRENGYNPQRLQIVAILRDWSKGEYEREVARCRELGFESSYPASQVAILDCPLIPPKEVIAYIQERAAAHMAAKSAPDDGLPECSPEERWAREDKWAVMEKGKKRAKKLYDSENEAELQASVSKNLYVQHRPGESIRCRMYCPVAKYCVQYKKMQEKKDE